MNKSINRDTCGRCLLIKFLRYHVITPTLHNDNAFHKLMGNMQRTTAISKVTVVETRGVLCSPEESHHRAAVVTRLLDFARSKKTFINININIHVNYFVSSAV